MYSKNIFAIQLQNPHIIIWKQINADFFSIVDCVPKILFKFNSIRNTCGRKASIWILRNAKQDHSTIAVCHGWIGIPQVLRKNILRLLCFKPVVLPVLIESVNIEFHAFLFLLRPKYVRSWMQIVWNAHFTNNMNYSWKPLFFQRICFVMSECWRWKILYHDAFFRKTVHDGTEWNKMEHMWLL